MTKEQHREAIRISQRAIILESLTHGATRSAACRAAGVPRRTFYAWLDQDPTFREEVEEAESSAIEAVEGVAYACAMQAAVDPRYFRFMAFFLDRKAGWNKLEPPTVPAPSTPAAAASPLGTGESQTRPTTSPTRPSTSSTHPNTVPATPSAESAHATDVDETQPAPPDAPEETVKSVQVVQAAEPCPTQPGMSTTAANQKAAPATPDRTGKPPKRRQTVHSRPVHAAT